MPNGRLRLRLLIGVEKEGVARSQLDQEAKARSRLRVDPNQLAKVSVGSHQPSLAASDR
jgi:hypothetical protein